MIRTTRTLVDVDREYCDATVEFDELGQCEISVEDYG